MRQRFLAAGIALASLAAPSAHADEPVALSVTITDGRIEPARAEVPAGQRIRIAVRNAGNGPCEFESSALRIEKVLAGGASSAVIVHPLSVGTYRFFDEFHPEAGEFVLSAK